MTTGKVYKLTDPRDGVVFYVGATIKPRDQRLQVHLQYARRGTAGELCDRLREIMAAGYMPSFVVIHDNVNPETLGVLETRTIEEYRATGHPLLNGTKSGGQFFSEALREKMSQSQQGQVSKRRSESLRRALNEPEGKVRRAAQRATPDAKARRSEQKRRRWANLTDEQRADYIRRLTTCKRCGVVGHRQKTCKAQLAT